KRQQDARRFFNEGHFHHLAAMKKQAKVGWAALGFNQEEIDLIKRKANLSPAADPTPKVVTPKDIKSKGVTGRKASTVIVDDPKTYPATSAGTARMLFDKKEFGALHTFKSAKKKSWSALGFT